MNNGQGNAKRDLVSYIVNQSELPGDMAFARFWDRLRWVTAQQSRDGIAAPQLTAIIQHAHQTGLEKARIGYQVSLRNDVPGFVVPVD
jgi:hypothetical protein